MEMYWTPNKNQHRKITQQKKILPQLLLGIELTNFRTRVQDSTNWALRLLDSTFLKASICLFLLFVPWHLWRKTTFLTDHISSKTTWLDTHFHLVFMSINLSPKTSPHFSPLFHYFRGWLFCSIVLQEWKLVREGRRKHVGVAKSRRQVPLKVSNSMPTSLLKKLKNKIGISTS